MNRLSPLLSRVPSLRSLRPILAVAGLAAALWYGGYWFVVGRHLETTNDAYVEADMTDISPKISGYVVEVAVADNQVVAAGSVLARIDRRDFEIARDRARAGVAEAEAGLANAEAQIALQQATITQAEAERTGAAAQLGFARQESERYQSLTHSGYGSTQRSQQAGAERLSKEALLARGTAAVEVSQRQLAVLNASRDRATADLARAQAALAAADLDLSHTSLMAPVSGAVGNRTVRVGQYVQPGMRLLSLVPTGSALYVTANFKETQLVDIRPGMAARLAVDGLGGAEIMGRVESISPATGSRFALLPPENATGNFTKIVQRVPIRITLDPGNPDIALLRNGLSVYASIDTRNSTPAAPASAP